MPKYLLKPCFNSIKVRLKDAEPRSRDGGAGMFQFHKGAIKRHHPELLHLVRPWFQFHKGAIKSLTRDTSRKLLCFVSIP